MKKILLLMIFALLSFITRSQNAYLLGDNFASHGVILVGGSEVQNCNFIIQRFGEVEKKHFPKDLTEYGLDDGKVYISKKIEIDGKIKRVFLRQLVKGKASLYVYTGKGEKIFLLLKDDKYTQLTEMIEDRKKSFFTDELTDLLSDCEHIKPKDIPYSQSYAVDLVKKYNNCKPFTELRSSFGFQIKTEFINLLGPSDGIHQNLLDHNYGSRNTIGFGVLFTRPILTSNIGMTAEINFSSISFLENFSNGSITNEIIYKVEKFNIPLTINYLFPFTKVKPYVSAGLSLDIFLKHEYSAFEYESNSNSVRILNLIEDVSLNKLQFGAQFGIGIDIPILKNKAVFMELGYSKFNLINSNTFSGTSIFVKSGLKL